MTDKSDSLPYVINDDGTVACFVWVFSTKNGDEFGLVVPIPKGPDEGWAPGQYERYMQTLEQRSMPLIRSGVKQRFGTTKFRRVREERVDYPLHMILGQHQDMTERMN